MPTTIDEEMPKVEEQPMFDIKKPHGNDVLCGRGVTTNKWAGNEQFRGLVACNKELYVTSTKRQKMAISRSIVDAIRSMTPAGRFLEKNPETCTWSDIGERKAIEKTSQALRDGAAELRKQLSADLHDPDFLSAVFDTDTNVEASAKKKKKLAKAKTVKKGHRRTRSNPDTVTGVRKKSLTRKNQRTSFNGRTSPSGPSQVGSAYPGSFSLPASPHTGRPGYFPQSPMMFPVQGEDIFREVNFGESPAALRSSSFDVPRSPMPHWTSPIAHRDSFQLASQGSFTAAPMSPVYPPALSPRGYWPYRHTMSVPHHSACWSSPGAPNGLPPLSPRSQASTSALMARMSPSMYRSVLPVGNESLSVPVLHATYQGNSEEPHPLAPKSYSSSPRDFTPPMSPKNDRKKRDEEKTLTPKTGDSNTPPLSMSALKHHNNSHSNDIVDNSGDTGVEVILHERSTCSSPMLLGGDIVMDETTETVSTDGSMTPLDPLDDTLSTMIHISEDLLKLPIAPVGLLDEELVEYHDENQDAVAALPVTATSAS